MHKFADKTGNGNTLEVSQSLDSTGSLLVLVRSKAGRMKISHLVTISPEEVHLLRAHMNMISPPTMEIPTESTMTRAIRYSRFIVADKHPEWASDSDEYHAEVLDVAASLIRSYVV